MTRVNNQARLGHETRDVSSSWRPPIRTSTAALFATGSRTRIGSRLGDAAWLWSEDTAERVRNELAPIPVEIDAQPPIMLFPPAALATQPPTPR